MKSDFRLQVALCLVFSVLVSGNAATRESPNPKSKPLLTVNSQTVLAALKKSSTGSLPEFLKVSDVDFKARDSFENCCNLRGRVTVVFLEDTYKPSRVLQYDSPSKRYRIQLLERERRRSEKMELPFESRVDLTASELRVPFPRVGNVGLESSKFPHSYVEESQRARKAESLIEEAKGAAREAALVQSKWDAAGDIQKALIDLNHFSQVYQQGTYLSGRILKVCENTALSEKVQKTVSAPYNSTREAQEAFRTLVGTRFNEEYRRLEAITKDAQAKIKECSNYLAQL